VYLCYTQLLNYLIVVEKIMRNIVLFLFLTCCSLQVFSQDFSNRGKEFYLAYCYHASMVNGSNTGTDGPVIMTVNMTSDVTSNFEIYTGNILAHTGTIAPGQVVSRVIDQDYFIDGNGLFNNKAIYVKFSAPSVIYSYITQQYASGATVILPINVLGKEYISSSYTQVSNARDANSYITIIAIEDNTTVEITPSAATVGGWAAGSVNTITLNKGQIYQVLGTITNISGMNGGSNGVDLSGTRIKSISSGSSGGCKKIAVFSGSGRLFVSDRPSGNNSIRSSDNLYQQLYPTTTWGKKYITVPSVNRLFNFYRIYKNGTAGTVTVNGNAVPNGNFDPISNYYEFSSSTVNVIEGSEPICVAQYFTSQGAYGNNGVYDPDMVILNPVEQNLSKVTLVSSELLSTSDQHHIHAVVKNGGTSLSSFRYDGNPIPVGNFTTVPGDPNYSFVYISAGTVQGNHTLACDSGFNAIAYGYADRESYAYSAGANVRDLYQYLTTSNIYAAPTETDVAACVSSPFRYRITLPYQPTYLKWDFKGLANHVNTETTNPVPIDDTIVNGRILYKYELPVDYQVDVVGTYPVSIITDNPTSDGCSGLQEIDFELKVYANPVANFAFTNNGCFNDPVTFKDISNPEKPVYKWLWTFVDDNTTSEVKEPVKTFPAPGEYKVRLKVLTTVGCFSNEFEDTIKLTSIPKPDFTFSGLQCDDSTITLTDNSMNSYGAIKEWKWVFADGSMPIIKTDNSSVNKQFTTAGTKVVMLVVTTETGCKDSISKEIIIHENPVPNFILPVACIVNNNANVIFKNTSTIADGTTNLITYNWDFGDPGSGIKNTSSVLNGEHDYKDASTYNVKLIATSNNNCMAEITKLYNTLYPQPEAGFTSVNEVCFRNAITFTDASKPLVGTITKWEWDFGDGSPIDNRQSPTHTYAVAGPYTVSLTITTSNGCVSNPFTKPITVLTLPVPNYNISNPTCVTRAINFDDITNVTNAGNITQYLWTFGDGQTQTKTNSDAFDYFYDITGPYITSLHLVTNKGCKSDTIKKDISISPLPVVIAKLPEICLADPTAPFDDLSTIADGTVANFTYLWDFGDVNATPANPNTSTIKNPTHKYLTTGLKNVSLTVTSNNNCAVKKDTSFFVNGTIPNGALQILNDQNLCSNTKVVVKNNSTVDVGNITRLLIQWDYANDPTIETIDEDPVPGKVYEHIYPEFGIPETKNVTVRIRAYSGGVCEDITEQDITLKASPNVSFNPIPFVCLEQGAVQITQGVENTGIPGSGLYFGNNAITNAGVFNPTISGVGKFELTYVFNANNTCTDTAKQFIDVYPTPLVDLGPDVVVLAGGTKELKPISVSSDVSGYLWTPSTFLSADNIANPFTTPPDDITYILRVTSTNGCTAKDDIFVKVLQAPVIPNTFTPNGDGVNDRWEIKYLDTYPGATIEVFNRYGQSIFRTQNYTAWDGKARGVDVPVGTYYYIINPKNGRAAVTGYVTVIR
jgi:gliding motility-associated-like protein